MPADAESSPYLLSGLADWAASLRYDDLPAAVARQARLSLLDTLGCMIAGFSQPDCQRILAAEKELSRASGRHAATVAVSGDALSVPAVAKVNSCMASILELDDNTAGHASLVTVPVGLAMAEAHHLSGRDLIASMAATYEVTGRMLDSYFEHLKPHGEAGMIPIAAPNTAGAAAQTAKLLGADAKGIFDAINVGLALVPFSPQVNAKVGSPVKPLVFSGWHVYAGCFAAMYMRQGLTAADDSYESAYGGYLRTVATSWDAAVLTDGLGRSWHLDAPNRKRHACCGYIHSGIDGTWDLLRDNGIQVGEIAGIHVELASHAFGLVGTPLLGELTPRGAQFYLPYILATALLEDRTILSSDTSQEALDRNLSDPSFASVMGSITVSLDAGISGRFASRLRLTTRDGREYTTFVEDAVGRGARQFTGEEVEAKFRTLASVELSDDAADRIIAMVGDIEQVDDIAELAALLRK